MLPAPDLQKVSQTQTETQYRVKDGSKMIPRGTKTTGEQVRHQVRNGGQGDLTRGLIVAKKHRSWNAILIHHKGITPSPTYDIEKDRSLSHFSHVRRRNLKTKRHGG